MYCVLFHDCMKMFASIGNGKFFVAQLCCIADWIS